MTISEFKYAKIIAFIQKFLELEKFILPCAFLPISVEKIHLSQNKLLINN